MHDPRLLSDQSDFLRTQLGSRGHDVPWDTIQSLSEKRRALIRLVEDMRHQLKQGSDRIAELKRNKQPADEPMAALRHVREQIQALELELRSVEEPLREQALSIPNVPHESVPMGNDERDNQEIRRWGDPPTLAFTPRSHFDLGETLGILDFPRATKIAGARFSVGIGMGAQLERALANFMLDLHVQEHGYTEVLPPVLVNRASMTGTGQLPKFEDDAFHLSHRRLISHSYGRSARHQSLSRRRSGDEPTSHSLCGPYLLLSPRSGFLWQRHARVNSRSSVSKSRTGQLCSSKSFL